MSYGLPLPTTHADGLRDGDVFTSITASERARWAAAAACTTTPLTQCSMDQAATVAAGLLKAFEREVADLKLLLTPEVRAHTFEQLLPGADTCRTVLSSQSRLIRTTMHTWCARMQAVERIVALDRCLSVPAGAVLLCGPSGSGRRTLLRLVAHTHGLRWWSPNINRCVCVSALGVFGSVSVRACACR